MAEKVWIRDYAEKVGADVDWDAETGTVVIDGEYHIYPGEIRDGKSYIDKKVVDAALSYLGYDTPDETPSTSKPTRKMKEEEERERYYETVPSRGLPSWGEIKDYVNTHIFKSVRDWVVDHIWQPVVNWVQPFVESIRQLIFRVRDIWFSLWEFLEKLKFSILESANIAKKSVLEYVSSTVEWFISKKDRLEQIIKDNVLKTVQYIVDEFNKISYIFTVAFDRLFMILEGPVHYVADAVVAGFELWCEKVFALVEDYIVDHWEDYK